MKGKGFLGGSSTAIVYVCLNNNSRTGNVLPVVNALVVVNNNYTNNIRHPATQPTARRHYYSCWGKSPAPLFGIMEDMRLMNNDDGEEAKPTNDDDDDDDDAKDPRRQQHEDLYHSLIFSSQLEREIRKHLNACGADDFIQYLRDSAINNGDEEEQQGLEELISMITTAKLEEEEEALSQTPAADTTVESTTDSGTEENSTATHSEPPPQPILSNADLIKRANQIDKAVAAAALSDDEKPSDFISDCREVVNLSGGFNNNGQMRVGGR